MAAQSQFLFIYNLHLYLYRNVVGKHHPIRPAMNLDALDVRRIGQAVVEVERFVQMPIKEECWCYLLSVLLLCVAMVYSLYAMIGEFLQHKPKTLAAFGKMLRVEYDIRVEITYNDCIRVNSIFHNLQPIV